MSLDRELMTLDEYQFAATKTAMYPGVGGYVIRVSGTDFVDHMMPLLYLGLKLAGEAGEVSEKVGKALRDGIDDEPAWAASVVKELGDVLWYVSQIARELGFTLQDVALTNLVKLADRKERGVLGGSGDDR